jgi:hypothetical protein
MSSIYNGKLKKNAKNATTWYVGDAENEGLTSRTSEKLIPLQ